LVAWLDSGVTNLTLILLQCNINFIEFEAAPA